MSEADYHYKNFRVEFGPSKGFRDRVLALSVTNNGYQYQTIRQTPEDWRLILKAIERVLNGPDVASVETYPEAQKEIPARDE